MSDDAKTERPAGHDDQADEVEGHAKLNAKLEGKTERPGVADEGDEVEAHGKTSAPKQS